MMNPSELELYSTRELIDELMRRTTFLGVVVHTREEARGPWSDGERSFKIRYSPHLDRVEAGRLLAIVSEHMQRNHS
jgi:hypothetical protein